MSGHPGWNTQLSNSSKATTKHTMECFKRVRRPLPFTMKACQIKVVTTITTSPFSGSIPISNNNNNQQLTETSATLH